MGSPSTYQMPWLINFSYLGMQSGGFTDVAMLERGSVRCQPHLSGQKSANSLITFGCCLRMMLLSALPEILLNPLLYSSSSSLLSPRSHDVSRPRILNPFADLPHSVPTPSSPNRHITIYARTELSTSPNGTPNGFIITTVVSLSPQLVAKRQNMIM